MSRLVREALRLGFEQTPEKNMDESVVQKLRAPLDASRVKSRQQSGRPVSYLEGYDIIDTANEIFGYDGWSYEVQDIKPIEMTARPMYQAVVAVYVGSAHRTDVGHGIAAGDSPEAQETAIKGAVTDAMKRAFRTFGAQFGNSLYDKDAGTTQRPKRPEARVSGLCPKHNIAWVKSERTNAVGHVNADGTFCLLADLEAAGAQ